MKSPRKMKRSVKRSVKKSRKVRSVRKSVRSVKKSFRKSKRSVKKVSRKRSYKMNFLKDVKNFCRGAFCGIENYVYFLNREGYDNIMEAANTENDGSITVENKEKLDELAGENGFRIKLGSKNVHSKLLDKPLEIGDPDFKFEQKDIEPLTGKIKKDRDYSKLVGIKALGFKEINDHCNKQICESKLLSIAEQNFFIYFSIEGGKITIKEVAELE